MLLSVEKVYRRTLVTTQPPTYLPLHTCFPWSLIRPVCRRCTGPGPPRPRGSLRSLGVERGDERMSKGIYRMHCHRGRYLRLQEEKEVGCWGIPATVFMRNAASARILSTMSALSKTSTLFQTVMIFVFSKPPPRLLSRDRTAISCLCQWGSVTSTVCSRQSAALSSSKLLAKASNRHWGNSCTKDIVSVTKKSGQCL